MHLTNYAINKHSEDFIRDDEAGSKRLVYLHGYCIPREKMCKKPKNFLFIVYISFVLYVVNSIICRVGNSLSN
jgi:hypothetical protein